MESITTNLLRVGSDRALLHGSSSSLDICGNNSASVCVFAVGLCKLLGTRDEGLAGRDLLDNERVRIGKGCRQSQRGRNEK